MNPDDCRWDLPGEKVPFSSILWAIRDLGILNVFTLLQMSGVALLVTFFSSSNEDFWRNL